jgi:putative hydrolase of the HAD superfamily
VIPRARDLDAVVFDAGNTLVEIDHARLVEIFAAQGVTFPSVAAARRAEARARPRLSDHIARGASTEDPATFRLYLALMLEEAAVDWDEGRLEAAFAATRAENDRRPLFVVPVDGARSALERLAGAELALGVVSNSDGRVEEKLSQVGLSGCFSVIVDSARIGIEKPDPRIFLHACRALDVEPARALYVGDLYAVDVVGARAAGLHAALLDPFGAYRERGVDVETVRDVVELAERVVG